MTLRTLNYGNYGIFLIMGHAGFCPSTVVIISKTQQQHSDKSTEENTNLSFHFLARGADVERHSISNGPFEVDPDRNLAIVSLASDLNEPQKKVLNSLSAVLCGSFRT